MSTVTIPSELLIGGRWLPGLGRPLSSRNGVTGEPVWAGAGADRAQVAAAVQAARAAFPAWSELGFAGRLAVVEAFGRQLAEHGDALATMIARETGKPRWEARSEVAAMSGKLPIAARAHRERLAERTDAAGDAVLAVRHRPHGVIAVFGPYNFPGHLPNGHIVPALLAGNTVVHKPSERTPGVAAMIAALWSAAGIPDGVLGLVHGDREVGAALAGDPGIDGLFFTGSAETGHALHTLLAGQPHKLLALELGGNNPLVIGAVRDRRAAVYMALQSAFASAGQRCTCARRLIVPTGADGDRFIDELVAAAAAIRVGAWDDEPAPFMGGVIDVAAADRLLDTQAMLLARGGRALLAMRRLRPGSSLLSPGLVDVTDARDVPDEEHFGPLLQLYRARDLDHAIAIANRTRFGLAAGLLGDDEAEYRRFFRGVRAGVVNWNQPLTGASSAAPFGGIGASGNHRPSAYYAADACAYPVASLEAACCALPATLAPGLAA